MTDFQDLEVNLPENPGREDKKWKCVQVHMRMRYRVEDYNDVYDLTLDPKEMETQSLSEASVLMLVQMTDRRKVIFKDEPEINIFLLDHNDSFLSSARVVTDRTMYEDFVRRLTLLTKNYTGVKER